MIKNHYPKFIQRLLKIQPQENNLFWKRVKDLNRNLTKEDMQKENKHAKIMYKVYH